MKAIEAQTKTSQGLTYLNLISIATMIVMLILVPLITTLFDVISSRVIYFVSIAFLVLNCGFYVVPMNIKSQIFQKRLLIVYIPTVIVFGFAVWNLITVLITVNLLAFFTVFFSFVSCLQPLTFSMLIAKLVQEQPTLLG